MNRRKKNAVPPATEVIAQMRKAEAEAAKPSAEPSAEQKKPEKIPLPKRLLRGLLRWIWRLIMAVVYVALCCAVGVTVLRHYEIDKTTYDKSFYRVQSNKLESNVRIVLLSDLHLNEFGRRNNTLINDIEELKPDMIAIVGDMNMDDNPDYSPILMLCERLVSIAPVYYTFGNHEAMISMQDESTIREDIEATGAYLTDLRIYRTTLNGNSFAICGVPYLPSEYGGYAKKIVDQFLQIDDAFTLMLTHYPEYFLADSGPLYYSEFDLALAGHAHGGHIRLPIIGGLYTTEQGLLPDLTEGVHSLGGGGKVVVSRGLGDSHYALPRINNPYELVVIDLNWY